MVFTYHILYNEDRREQNLVVCLLYTSLDGSRGLEPIFDYSFGSKLVGKEVVQKGKEVKHAV